MPPRCNCGSLARHVHFGGGALPVAAAAEMQIGAPINGAIDATRLEFFNVAASATQPASDNAKIFDLNVEPGSLCVVSDSDDELLIHVPFREFVAVRAVTVMGRGGGQSPGAVKLYANRTNVNGFDAIRRAQIDETIPLARTEVAEEVVYALNAPFRFSNLSTLTLLFHDSTDGDHSAVCRVVLWGESTGRQVNPKMVGTVVYELRPNPADYVQQREEQLKSLEGGSVVS